MPEVRALAWYLDRHPALLADARRVLVLRARPGAYLSALGGAEVVCYQPNRIHATALEAQGYPVTVTPAGTYDAVLYLGSRFVDENLFLLATGADLLVPDGLLLAAMPNVLGAGRYARHLDALLGGVLSESKYKARVFGGRKTDRLDRTLLASWLAEGALTPLKNSTLYTGPGMFARKAVDVGSRLLAAHLPRHLKGTGADLGAGYGYLTHAVLSQSPHVEAVHLYEVEHNALDAARHNLAPFAERVALTYQWADVTQGLAHKKLDWIIANPPFHRDRRADVRLGQAFIEAAAAGVRKGGHLYLVANRHLPYEAIMETSFRQVHRVAQADGFKVFACRR